MFLRHQHCTSDERIRISLKRFFSNIDALQKCYVITFLFDSKLYLYCTCNVYLHVIKMCIVIPTLESRWEVKFIYCSLKIRFFGDSRLQVTLNVSFGMELPLLFLPLFGSGQNSFTTSPSGKFTSATTQRASFKKVNYGGKCLLDISSNLDNTVSVLPRHAGPHMACARHR